MPPASYQPGLNLLRGFNLDIAVIQILTRQEVDPPFSNGGLDLVDSETNAQVRFQWDAGARKAYQTRMAHHNSEIRSFCHRSGIGYSLYITDRDVGDFIFATLPTMGLFK